jgi:phosphoglycolate phosphatase-like HAD superfamily hydrolase
LHLVWDWNGTVLNDFDVSFRSTNSSFRDAGLPEITTATYRALLRSPIRSFYAAEWHGAGHTQSLRSLFPHRKLVPAVERHGLTSYFALVQGATPPYAEQKDVADHLARLKVDPATAVLIGDLADDAHAAEQAGVKVVLYSGGFGARADLAATGAPVADSLTEAVELIDSL